MKYTKEQTDLFVKELIMLLECNIIAYRSGILQIENVIKAAEEFFIRFGLQFVVEGSFSNDKELLENLLKNSALDDFEKIRRQMHLFMLQKIHNWKFLDNTIHEGLAF